MPVTAKGLEGIVANTTRLSDVIGDKGQLIYCGYDINELAGKVSYQGGRLPPLEGETAESPGARCVHASSCARSGSCPAA